MTQRVFDLIDAINREGIEPGMWALYDLKDGVCSNMTFGTVEYEFVEGKVLVLYVKDDDTFCFVKPETADLILTMAEDEKIHIWKI